MEKPARNVRITASEQDQQRRGERLLMHKPMDIDQLNHAMAESNARARRGHNLAWVMLAMTAALAAFVTYAFVVADRCSGMMCPMFEALPWPNVGDVTMGAGFAGLAAGLIWMWRIVRADRDPDARSSRLHRP
jgi:hypothetical protein